MNLYLDDSTSFRTLSQFPTAPKALVTVIILTLGIAFLGALGQIIVHDVMPTFFSDNKSTGEKAHHAGKGFSKEVLSDEDHFKSSDLSSNLDSLSNNKAQLLFYQDEQFVWLLKWSHIHLFGMNMIFIFMGAITVFTTLPNRIRIWLVILPFVGVLIDIAAMWLKTYVSDVFFWLHVPGGGIFITIYCIVSTKALMEMWLKVGKN